MDEQKGRGMLELPRLEPNFRLPRYTKKSKRPSGSPTIHKKRRIRLQGFSGGAQD